MPRSCQKRSRSRTSARELVGIEHGAGPLDVEADLAGEAQQHVAGARVLAAGVIRAQQRMLQGPLLVLALEPGPVQQAMGVEGVPDPGPLAEIEADGGAALAQDGAGWGELLGWRPYFREM